MLRHIKILSILFSLSVVFMIYGIMKNTFISQTMSRGNYFFENTRNNAYVESIVLAFPTGEKITFMLNDGLWRVKEADDYYADFSKINYLIKLINNTIIYRADKLENSPVPDVMKEALSITSIDKDGNIVDEAHIAPKHDNNKYYYAMLNQQPILYQLDGQINISPLLMDWVHAPLLAIPYTQIKRIKTDDFHVYRQIPGGPVLDLRTKEPVSHVQNLAQHFWYLSADEIKHALHFDRSHYKQTKSFSITVFDGAIYELTLYYNQDDYWLSIKLDREKIVVPSVIKQIKENTMLYDGWYFKINSSVGSAIANFYI